MGQNSINRKRGGGERKLGREGRVHLFYFKKKKKKNSTFIFSQPIRGMTG
jgi:hypothetical protein